MRPGSFFAAQAFSDRIPFATLVLKCRNWGISVPRAGELIEDAVAEAYQRSLNESFHDDAHYRAWLTRTATNVTVDILRREQRIQHLGFCDREVASPLRTSLASVVHSALATLADDEQLLLRMTFEEGLTLDEIVAQVIAAEGGSANAKRLRIKRKRDMALMKMRAYLTHQGFSLIKSGTIVDGF